MSGWSRERPGHAKVGLTEGTGSPHEGIAVDRRTVAHTSCAPSGGRQASERAVGNAVGRVRTSGRCDRLLLQSKCPVRFGFFADSITPISPAPELVPGRNAGKGAHHESNGGPPADGETSLDATTEHRSQAAVRHAMASSCSRPADVCPAHVDWVRRSGETYHHRLLRWRHEDEPAAALSCRSSPVHCATCDCIH